MNLPRHLLAAFFTTIILVGCDSKESSQLKEVTYEPTSQPSPTEKAEVIGDALGIAEPMPSIDSDGQELLGVRSPQLLYSDAGLMVALQGKVTVADGAQTNKTLWRQVSGPAAQILNASQKQAEVIIPQVAKITDLEFAFAAADTSNRVAEARTRIRVSPLEFLGIIAQSTAVVSTGLVTITLSLPKPPEAAVILQYRTQDGSALAGRDYESAQGQVTLTQENPKATIEITALNSDVASGDLYFILNYSVGPTGPWSSIYVALPAEREGSVPSEPPGSNLSSSSNSSSSTSSGSASTSSSSSSSSTSSSSSASSSTSSSSSSSSNSSSSGLSLVIPTNQNRKIAAGPNHAVAIKADGSVLAWGRNEHRQCQVPEGLKDVISVAAGDYHNMALTADGTVVAWGANGSIFSTKADSGQLDVPPDLKGVIAISAGPRYSMALRADGTIITWGNGPKAPPELGNLVAIAAGANHSLALQADGKVVAWGDNHAGQSAVPEGLTNVVAIAAAGDQSFALKSSGHVIGWGDIASSADLPEDATLISANYTHLLYTDASGNPHTVRTKSSFCDACISVPSDITSAQEISAGQTFNIALEDDGSIKTWGVDANGQLGTIGRLSNIETLSAQGAFGLAITADGKVQSFGDQNSNLQSVPEHTESLKAITIGSQNISTQPLFALALDRRGAITKWGDGASEIKTPDHQGDIRAVVADDYGLVVILTNSGTVESLGDGTTEFNETFSRFSDVVDITSEMMLTSAGEAITYEKQRNGEAVMWIRKTIATDVKALASVTDGATVDCMISIKGDVNCYDKYNSSGAPYGLLTIPQGIVKPIKLACGDLHCLALQENGEVVAWGDELNTYSVVKDIPPQLKDVVDIFAFSTTNYAILKDGRVATWGFQYIPPGLHELFAPGGVLIN